jgi:hypothetical protein
MKTSERVGRMKRLGLPLLSIILALSVAASASPVPVMAPYTTSSTISGPDFRTINVSVTSTIWNYADYMALNPGTSILSGTYIYEYVVQNSANSNVSISMFQVPISSPGAIVGIGTANNNGGIGALSFIVDPATLPSATYLFLTPALAPGTSSVKLIYASNAAWTTSTATVAGGSITGDLTQVRPVPEPVTAVLFGFGGLALLRKRRAS